MSSLDKVGSDSVYMSSMIGKNSPKAIMIDENKFDGKDRMREIIKMLPSKITNKGHYLSIDHEH